MIHKEQIKNKETGELETKYTTDREDCKIVIVDGSPVEQKMDIEERRNRRDGQSRGKFKQKGVSKLQKKNERLRDERNKEMKKDIEERLGEFVDKIISIDIENKLSYTKPTNILESINMFLEKNDPKNEEDEEEEDIDNIEIKSMKDLSDKEKKLAREISDKLLSNKDKGEEEGEEDPEKGGEEEKGEEEEGEEEGEEDPEKGGEEEEGEEDPEEGEKEEGEKAKTSDDESPVDPLEGDNDIAKYTKEMEFNIDANNAYDYYEFLLKKFIEESDVSLINSSYMAFPEEKRKLVPAKELLDKINSVIIKHEEEPDPMDMGMGGGF